MTECVEQFLGLTVRTQTLPSLVINISDSRGCNTQAKTS